jgi:hypothetical protein
VVVAEPTRETADDPATLSPWPAPDADDTPTDERQLRLVPPEEADGGVVQALPSASAASPGRRRVGPGDLIGGGVVLNEQPAAAAPESEPSPVTRFRPGRRSSAQLDLQLVPRGAEDRAARRSETARAGVR